MNKPETGATLEIRHTTTANRTKTTTQKTKKKPETHHKTGEG